ncbi:hypothetical protein H9Q73_014375, partial [Fusarium xylarioides]
IELAYPAPPSSWSTHEPTPDSTKTNWPTLDRVPHTQLAAGPRIDPRIDQDRAAYPAPSNTQPAHNRARLDGIEFHQVQLDYPAPPVRRRHIEKPTTPYKSPEIRRTHWGNRGEGRLTLSRS